MPEIASASVRAASGFVRSVLVMHGESGKMVPTTNTIDLDRRLPDSQLVIDPDAGHGGVFELHEDFVASALAFLSDGR